MKFSVSKGKLLEGLSTVQNVVSTRTTLPILSNVLLQASDGEIRLTTTDLDVGVRGSVEAQVERTGATTLPARRLFSIVRELPASEIYFDVDTKNCASIRSGSSYFKILGLPQEEFPSLTRFEDAKIFTIAQKVLKDGLKKTSYAISTDETRYVLNGILFSFKDNKLTMVATDGRRLTLIDLEVEFPRSQETEVIVPAKAVTEIQRLVREEGEVKLGIGQNQIAFELKRTLLVSKLIEGNYPNYRQVIPSEESQLVVPTFCFICHRSNNALNSSASLRSKRMYGAAAVLPQASSANMFTPANATWSRSEKICSSPSHPQRSRSHA